MPPRKRPERVCPASHAHGASATCRSLHGCMCGSCREHAAFLQRRRYWAVKTRRPLMVDATGSQRRIRALQTVGYSYLMIGRLCGRSESWVGAVLRNNRVSPGTARRIADVYRRVAFTPPVGRSKHERAGITKTRNYARAHGFLGPLDWDRIDTDPEPGRKAAA